jgi:hypothetical protein
VNSDAAGATKAGWGELMRTVGRVLAIAAAYLAACYVSGAVFVAVLFNPVTAASDGVAWQSAVATMLYMMVFAGLAVGAVTAIVALLPTAALIVYAEAARRRSRRFHAIGGALIGPVAFIAFVVLIGRGPVGFDDATWSVLALLGASIVSGIAGALTYWALAGRRAGVWRSRPDGSTPGEMRATPPARS